MALHDPKCDITFPFLFFRFRNGKYTTNTEKSMLINVSPGKYAVDKVVIRLALMKQRKADV